MDRTSGEWHHKKNKNDKKYTMTSGFEPMRFCTTHVRVPIHGLNYLSQAGVIAWTISSVLFGVKHIFPMFVTK